jgi:hypothetical protein
MSNIAMSVVGKQALSRDDILPALEDMRRKLMERNVAEVGAWGWWACSRAGHSAA